MHDDYNDRLEDAIKAFAIIEMNDALDPSPPVMEVVSFLNAAIDLPKNDTFVSKPLGGNLFEISFNPRKRYTEGKNDNEFDKEKASDSEKNNSESKNDNPDNSRKELNDSIDDALRSVDKDKRLEGKVADWLRDEIRSFNKKVPPHGELDVELDDIIVEVTSKKSGKLSQIQKYLSNSSLNPLGKKIILYSEDYNWRAKADILREGGFVASNKEELFQIIKQLRAKK